MTEATAKPDRIVKLRALPVTINVDAIARGLLDMFGDDERGVLRFGLLPAGKMEVLENMLREKFEGLGQNPRDVFPSDLVSDIYGDDDRISRVNGEVREWNIRKLVSEATHEIILAIYAIGNLIV